MRFAHYTFFNKIKNFNFVKFKLFKISITDYNLEDYQFTIFKKCYCITHCCFCLICKELKFQHCIAPLLNQADVRFVTYVLFCLILPAVCKMWPFCFFLIICFQMPTVFSLEIDRAALIRFTFLRILFCILDNTCVGFHHNIKNLIELLMIL